jgi:hypothetical protein
VFRIPILALFAVALLASCITPVAFAAPGLPLLYLVPLGIAMWVVRTRTTVDATGLVVRRVFSRRVIPWSHVRSLRVIDRSQVRAVLDSGDEQPLPAVHPRDLPVLAAASGGHLPDPTAESNQGRPADTAE